MNDQELWNDFVDVAANNARNHQAAQYTINAARDAIAQAVQAEREAMKAIVDPYVYALKHCGDRKQADLRDMANELDAAIRARNGAGRK